MRVGFVHGVMNTDNMSILGLTIDYGPYGWIDNFDPDWTPNTTDAGGRRYRFGHQPRIAHWNLWQLANAIYPVIDQVEPLERALAMYAEVHEAEYRRMMADKLGFAAWQAGEEGEEGEEGDDALLDELHRVLQQGEIDMTLFFRQLALVEPDAAASPDTMRHALAYFDAACYDPSRRAACEPDLLAWLARYARRSAADPAPGADPAARRDRMNRANPLYVPRNYLAQQAIDAAEQGDLSELETLMDTLRQPYTEQPGRARFAARRPDWARNKPGCSMLSCSS